MSQHPHAHKPSEKSSAQPGSPSCVDKVDAAIRILEACGNAPGLFERLSPELSAAVNATLVGHLAGQPAA